MKHSDLFQRQAWESGPSAGRVRPDQNRSSFVKTRSSLGVALPVAAEPWLGYVPGPRALGHSAFPETFEGPPSRRGATLRTARQSWLWVAAAVLIACLPGLLLGGCTSRDRDGETAPPHRLAPQPSPAPAQSQGPSQPRAAPPASLAATGLYDSGAVSPRALHYSPQYPLWSDGARKSRWIVLPSGKTIDAKSPDRWDFPSGTRFFKEFSDEKKLETRTIEKLPDGSHQYAAYVWSENQTDATLAPREGIAIERPGREPYLVPAEAECRACHEGRTSPILGFGALQLSPDRDPLAPHQEPPSPGSVDLTDLLERHLLEHYDGPTAPRIPAPTPVARAAAGYLFGNCANCHNAEGPLSELELTFDHSVVDAQSYERMRKTAQSDTALFSMPGETKSKRTVPGSADRSVIALRLESRAPVLQMPPLGTTQVDSMGVQLVRDWIAHDL